MILCWKKRKSDCLAGHVIPIWSSPFCFHCKKATRKLGTEYISYILETYQTIYVLSNQSQAIICPRLVHQDYLQLSAKEKKGYFRKVITFTWIKHLRTLTADNWKPFLGRNSGI